jgi:hypothetical protein
MCFGWYQELLRETRARDLAAAEAELLDMLDHGGMIVHAYRDADRENPELVGRHSRLRSFISADDRERLRQCAPLPHEVERFLLDSESLSEWSCAQASGGLLERRWAIVELYSAAGQGVYGKAVLAAPAPAGPPVSRSAIDLGNDLSRAC